MSRLLASRRQFLLAALGAPFVLRSPGLLAATCPAPATSVLGDTYKPDAPVRGALLVDQTEEGAKLRMTGIVTAADTCRRIRDAVVEVWQADAAGRMDMDAARLRGKFTTSALGRYTFDTIVPGHVRDAARTIHFRVSSKGYETRVTQCFFAGDERERADTLVKPELRLTLGDAKDPANPKLLLGTFDISLTPEATVDAATLAIYATYAGTYDVWLDQKLKIAVEEKHLRWTLTRPENPGEAVTGLLYPRTGSEFFWPEYDCPLAFVRDPKGAVTHALIRNRQIAKKIG